MGGMPFTWAECLSHGRNALRMGGMPFAWAECLSHGRNALRMGGMPFAWAECLSHGRNAFRMGGMPSFGLRAMHGLMPSVLHLSFLRLMAFGSMSSGWSASSSVGLAPQPVGSTVSTQMSDDVYVVKLLCNDDQIFDIDTSVPFLTEGASTEIVISVQVMHRN